MTMSSTIAMSENNIENISNSSAIFGESKAESLKERRSTPVPVFDTKSTQNPNCVTHQNEKHSTKQNKMKEINSNGANHILCPAKIENMKENLSKKATSAKSIAKSNCIENYSAATIVGASGDGLQQNEQIKLLTKSKQMNNCLSSKSEHNHENTQNCKTEVINNDSLPSKTKPQTYAKAAQNSSVIPILKTDCNIVFEGKPGPPTPQQYKSILKPVEKTASNAEFVETPLLVNGVEENVSSVSTSSPLTFVNSECLIGTSYEKALKETIGHISTRLPEDLSNSRSIDAQPSNDPEFQILSTSEGADDGAQDVFLQQDGAINSVDPEPADGSLSKLNAIRREAEKPPRMQKQRSQDRLLLKQQKPSFDADLKRETLSRESSVECVDSMGVDVHEFLVNTLRNSSRDRAILMKIEYDMIAFVNNKTIDFMKFPPMTSYHRMLVHRVAAYFGMDHNVDETGKSVIINKTSSTRLPEARFADQFDPRQPDPHSSRREDDMRRRSILKRTNQSRSFDRDDIKGGALWKDSQQRSIEEREEQYEKVRARIFNNPEALMHSPPMYGRRGVSSLAAAKMASWSDRPWNSTDFEPTSGMRMPMTRPLTTRASSYSSISVLPRHNSATSVKTGSSSSVSSMNGVNAGFSQGRQPPNMGNPRPPTPGRRNGGATMGENNNGTYYYMQQQSQGMPYLSPEGYQLIYQSGTVPTGGTGMTSPQFARYYQMPPPQPSPQHPGMNYPQGYNPYQESPQKGSNSMNQGSSNTDYPMAGPMSSYSQNSSTTTVYSGVNAQQHMSYAYQPPSGVQYRSPQDQAISNVPLTQSGIQQIPHNTNTQAKQGPSIVPVNPNYIQQQVPSPGYPPGSYLIAQQPNIPGLQQMPQTGKDATQTHNAATPKMVLAQPVHMLQQTPPMYPQQPTQVLYPQHVSTVTATPNNAEGYQNVQQSNTVKSSSHTHDRKKLAEDELNEKMQAIVLKNMQQQHGQMPESVVSDASITVTTSVSPSNPIQQPQTVPESAGQNRMSTHVGQHRHATESHGYHYQYPSPSGMQQQPQPMQVYLMPTNAQTAGGTSYRTYSQFMTQPQTPHVMGPGMHFVYLSPPVMGMDGASTIAVPPSAPGVHSHGQQIPEVGPAYTSNTNNNNTQSTSAENHQAPLHNVQDLKTSDVSDEPTLNMAKDSVSAQMQITTTVTECADEDANSIAPAHEISPAVPETNTLPNCVASPSSNMTNQGVVATSESLPVSDAIDSAPSDSTPHSVTSSAVETSTIISTHPASEHSVYYTNHGHHHAVMQHQNSPMILDYRMAGMTIGNPASYPPGVIPQYSMYPGINQTPYVYLPAAAANSRSPKLQEVKMFPAQAAASHSPGLVAVQLPNQNQIQLVPAASLQQNQVYYAPNNYIPADYTNQAAIATQHQTYVKQELPQNTDAAQQSKEIANIEPVKNQEKYTENADPDATSDAAQPDVTSVKSSGDSQ